jgi:hypothetical protein
MNNLVKFSFLGIIFVVFFVGISVGHYETFPFNIIKDFRNNYFNTNIHDNNSTIIDYSEKVNELIEINSEFDIIEKRNSLKDFIWKESVPFNSKLIIEKEFLDIRYSDLSNLKSIDKITTEMEYQVNSIAYLFMPHSSKNTLVVFHQGHDGDFIISKDLISTLLDEGYPVLAFSMPLLGMNNQPIVDTKDLGTLQLTTHGHFFLIEDESFSPMKLFLEPIGTSLNYIDANYNFESYVMIGISGGGWTTTLYSSIDDRIEKSFSIAGSYPIFLRSEAKNIGDYEQINPQIYRIANYLELYLMDSYGDNRSHYQIFNKFDPCCFDGDIRGIYDEEIKSKLLELGKGNFFLIIDDSTKVHNISNNSLELILDSLNN